MITNKSKGFTIIELLVVVAIIAVLASIVLVNVTSYINKGKDSAIKGNMASVQVSAAAYFDTNGNYTSLGSDSNVSAAVSSINSAYGSGTASVLTSATAWCLQAPLKAGGSNWCVDSTGYKGTVGTSKCTGTTYTCQ